MEEGKDKVTAERKENKNSTQPDNTASVQKRDRKCDSNVPEDKSAGEGVAKRENTAVNAQSGAPDGFQAPAPKHRAKKAFKIIGNVVFYSVIAVFLVAGVIALIGKAQGKNNNISLFGYNFYVVGSSSMSRVNEEHAEFLKGHDDRIAYDAAKGYGDLIITKSIPKDYKLKKYDVVTYSSGRLTIVHRIVDIRESGGVTEYLTRGDSNNSDDGWRTRDEFTGILVKNAGMGWANVVRFLQSGYGIAAVSGTIAIILTAVLISTVLDEKAKKKKAAAAAAEASADPQKSGEDRSEDWIWQEGAKPNDTAKPAVAGDGTKAAQNKQSDAKPAPQKKQGEKNKKPAASSGSAAKTPADDSEDWIWEGGAKPPQTAAASKPASAKSGQSVANGGKQSAQNSTAKKDGNSGVKR